MRSWQRIILGGLLVVAVAAAGIALNFALLGLTQQDDEPVGKLSPRAVFDRGTTGPDTTQPSTTDDSARTPTDERSGTTTEEHGGTTTEQSGGSGSGRDHDEDD